MLGGRSQPSGTALQSAHDSQYLQNIVVERIPCYATGVRRLPALLSTGLELKDIGCPEYEILACEPLHNLKNLIAHLLAELPHQVTEPALKRRVKEFCEGCLDKQQPNSDY